MQITIQYMRLCKIIPDLTFAESEAIYTYWRGYYDDPIKYANLKDLVIDWLRNGEGKKIVHDYEREG